MFSLFKGISRSSKTSDDIERGHSFPDEKTKESQHPVCGKREVIFSEPEIEDGTIFVFSKGSIVQTDRKLDDLVKVGVTDISIQNSIETLRRMKTGSLGSQLVKDLETTYSVLRKSGIKRERPSKEEVAMRMAFLVSQLSTCVKANVGAVLTDSSFRMISSGFNGVPSGFTHCSDVYNVDNHSSIFDIHAEVNAIESCRWSPVHPDYSCLFVTHLPCMKCAHTVVAAKSRLNIAKVYYASIYDNDDPTYDKYQDETKVKEFFSRNGIELKVAVD